MKLFQEDLLHLYNVHLNICLSLLPSRFCLLRARIQAVCDVTGDNTRPPRGGHKDYSGQEATSSCAFLKSALLFIYLFYNCLWLWELQIQQNKFYNKLAWSSCRPLQVLQYFLPCQADGFLSLQVSCFVVVEPPALTL